MKFQSVCIESIGYCVPTEIWTSADVETRLKPLYSRLKLPEGRLELMTGIRERRFWEPGMKPSQWSVTSGELALSIANFDRRKIGCLIHGSVCRDFLEPATACTVHHQLQLPAAAVIYDVSNACLGLLNGMLQAANMIELGQIQAAIVVGTEGGRQLVENTIATLNQNTYLNRQSIKQAFASLTIGSASCAILLTHESISQTGNRLLAAAVTANTQYHDLCQSDHDQAGSEMAPLMNTDSELLMSKGVETGVANMQTFLQNSGWSIADINKTVCHQVGGSHRKMMLENLQIDPKIDFPTFSWLGNTGAVALPVALAAACETGFIVPTDNVALLGIGSGINCIMLATQWQRPLVAANPAGVAHRYV